MFRLPRRFLMWGGAAVVAASGFAFMASNSVMASSAGDGSGTVTGYTAQNISYTVSKGPNARISGVSFTLVANSNDASALTKPSTVSVYFTQNGSPVSSLLYAGTPPAGGLWPYTGDGNVGGDHVINACTITSWNQFTGLGHVTCTGLLMGPGYQGPTVGGFNGLDVEANQ